VPDVVRVAGEDRQGAVNLFCEYDARKLVWEGQTAKRQKEVGALACNSGPPIDWADGEHKALNAIIANAPNVRRKLLGGVLLAAAIEQNRISGNPAWLAIQPFEDRSLGVKELGIAGHVPRGAFNIVG
jgi:hypothetical protein